MMYIIKIFILYFVEVNSKCWQNVSTVKEHIRNPLFEHIYINRIDIFIGFYSFTSSNGSVNMEVVEKELAMRKYLINIYTCKINI